MSDTPTPTGEALQALQALKAMEGSADKLNPASGDPCPRYDDAKERAWIEAAHAEDKTQEPT